MFNIYLIIFCFRFSPPPPFLVQAVSETKPTTPGHFYFFLNLSFLIHFCINARSPVTVSFEKPTLDPTYLSIVGSFIFSSFLFFGTMFSSLFYLRFCNYFLLFPSFLSSFRSLFFSLRLCKGFRFRFPCPFYGLRFRFPSHFSGLLSLPS